MGRVTWTVGMNDLPDIHLCAFRTHGRNSIYVGDIRQLEGLRIGTLTFDIEATTHPDWPETLHVIADSRVKSVEPFPVTVRWADCPYGRSA